jgi:gamma-glutamyl-gamma-aminobutyrate hydrolase PuuD
MVKSKKKPTSAKSKAAKAKREKMTMESNATETRERVEESFDRTWKRDVPGETMDNSYPSTRQASIHDFLTAEEIAAEEERLYGKKGAPNDDSPAFLHASAKAGPIFPDEIFDTDAPLDALGRRKDQTIKQLPLLTKDVKPTRAITIMRDHELQYPDLYMSVFVAPDWAVKDDEARFAKLFSRTGCYRADSVDEADLVIFGGGSDVEPLLYGEANEEMHPSVFYDSKRDAADMEIYLQARAIGVPIMGVCRGAQFLHVMNGGKLYQDIDGHNGAHKAFALQQKDMIDNVSSVHHQACMFNREGGMEVLLTNAGATSVRWLNKDIKDTKPNITIEAFYYRDTGCFGVQGHPEYSGFNKYSMWCLERVSDLFVNSQDFCWDGKRLRMTKEARDAAMMEPSMGDYIENTYNPPKEA